MKKLILAILSLFALNAFAQSPVYVLFNASCMDQLEYRYTKSGKSVFAYSIRPSADEQYVFMSGESGMPTQSLPDGTYDCRNLKLNDEAVKVINQNSATRQMYIIIQRPQDYLMMPIYSATQIKRVGSYYLLVSPKYVFAIDTTKLSYKDNLQGESSQTIIRFTGTKLAKCRYQYSFHGDPGKNYKESMDFDFIYGLGIVNSRSGTNSNELIENEMQLVGVNGNFLEEYLTTSCRNAKDAKLYGNSASKWTETPETGYIAQDKEAASANNNNYVWRPDQDNSQTNNQNYNPQFANCPEMPGPGYHIVQRGESLKAISRTYGVDLKSIIRWNDIKNPDHIEICQKIWLQNPPVGGAARTSVSKGAVTTNTNSQTGPTVVNQSTYWNQANNAATPGQYNYTPSQYSTQSQFANKAGYHSVQKGETLFGISKRYGCAEECFRRANNMPLEGNVTLQIGQALVIPECTCQVTGSQTQSDYNGTRGVPAVPSVISDALNNQTQQQQPYLSPTVYDYQNQNPNMNRTQQTPVAGGGVQQSNQGQQTNTQDLPPTQEYIVRQGETMNSIAIKFKMNVAELSQLNSIGVDEKLVPGKRLVVRRY